eukprot:tig00020556_g11054.t1
MAKTHRSRRRPAPRRPDVRTEEVAGRGRSWTLAVVLAVIALLPAAQAVLGVTGDFATPRPADAWCGGGSSGCPAVASIWPAEGPVEGGTQVTVSGMHFVSGASVQCHFGGVAVAAYVNSSKTLLCTAPQLPEGYSEFRVTQDGAAVGKPSESELVLYNVTRFVLDWVNETFIAPDYTELLPYRSVVPLAFNAYVSASALSAWPAAAPPGGLLSVAGANLYGETGAGGPAAWCVFGGAGTGGDGRGLGRAARGGGDAGLAATSGCNGGGCNASVALANGTACDCTGCARSTPSLPTAPFAIAARPSSSTRSGCWARARPGDGSDGGRLQRAGGRGAPGAGAGRPEGPREAERGSGALALGWCRLAGRTLVKAEAEGPGGPQGARVAAWEAGRGRRRGDAAAAGGAAGAAVRGEAPAVARAAPAGFAGLLVRDPFTPFSRFAALPVVLVAAREVSAVLPAAPAAGLHGLVALRGSSMASRGEELACCTAAAVCEPAAASAEGEVMYAGGSRLGTAPVARASAAPEPLAAAATLARALDALALSVGVRSEGGVLAPLRARLGGRLVVALSPALAAAPRAPSSPPPCPCRARRGPPAPRRARCPRRRLPAPALPLSAPHPPRWALRAPLRRRRPDRRRRGALARGGGAGLAARRALLWCQAGAQRSAAAAAGEAASAVRCALPAGVAPASRSSASSTPSGPPCGARPPLWAPAAATAAAPRTLPLGPYTAAPLLLLAGSGLLPASAAFVRLAPRYAPPGASSSESSAAPARLLSSAAALVEASGEAGPAAPSRAPPRAARWRAAPRARGAWRRSPPASWGGARARAAGPRRPRRDTFFAAASDVVLLAAAGGGPAFPFWPRPASTRPASSTDGRAGAAAVLRSPALGPTGAATGRDAGAALRCGVPASAAAAFVSLSVPGFPGALVLQFLAAPALGSVTPSFAAPHGLVAAAGRASPARSPSASRGRRALRALSTAFAVAELAPAAPAPAPRRPGGLLDASGLLASAADAPWTAASASGGRTVLAAPVAGSLLPAAARLECAFRFSERSAVLVLAGAGEGQGASAAACPAPRLRPGLGLLLVGPSGGYPPEAFLLAVSSSAAAARGYVPEPLFVSPAFEPAAEAPDEPAFADGFVPPFAIGSSWALVRGRGILAALDAPGPRLASAAFGAPPLRPLSSAAAFVELHEAGAAPTGALALPADGLFEAPGAAWRALTLADLEGRAGETLAPLAGPAFPSAPNATATAANETGGAAARIAAAAGGGTILLASSASAAPPPGRLFCFFAAGPARSGPAWSSLPPSRSRRGAQGSPA